MTVPAVLAMAVIVLSFPGIFYYLPVMLLFLLPTGHIAGLLADGLTRYAVSPAA